MFFALLLIVVTLVPSGLLVAWWLAEALADRHPGQDSPHDAREAHSH